MLRWLSSEGLRLVRTERDPVEASDGVAQLREHPCEPLVARRRGPRAAERAGTPSFRPAQHLEALSSRKRSEAELGELRDRVAVRTRSSVAPSVARWSSATPSPARSADRAPTRLPAASRPSASAYQTRTRWAAGPNAPGRRCRRPGLEPWHGRRSAAPLARRASGTRRSAAASLGREGPRRGVGLGRDARPARAARPTAPAPRGTGPAPPTGADPGGRAGGGPRGPPSRRRRDPPGRRRSGSAAAGPRPDRASYPPPRARPRRARSAGGPREAAAPTGTARPGRSTAPARPGPARRKGRAPRRSGAEPQERRPSTPRRSRGCAAPELRRSRFRASRRA